MNGGSVPPIRTGRTLSVMPTWRCTASCGSCGTMSSPKEGTWLDPAVMYEAIDQAAANDYQVVVFTGGEPSLANDVLVTGIRRAAAHGLAVRVVTNAHWAVTDERADDKLAAWIGAGLGEINYSTGDQHARFVPVERVVRAARLAARRGLRVAIMVELTQAGMVTAEAVRARDDFQALFAELPDARVSLHESPWMPLSPTVVAEYPPGTKANASNVAGRSGCEGVLTTTTLQPNGQYAACCGLGMRLIPELQLGRADEMTLAAADERAANDFLKRWIRVEGPERILAWASEKDAAIEWEDMYAHRCQACLRLYQDKRVGAAIRNHYAEKVTDVTFGEWLLYRYRPEADTLEAPEQIGADRGAGVEGPSSGSAGRAVGAPSRVPS